MAFISSTNDTKLLIPEDFTDAAIYLGVDIPTIQAVSEVESAGSGFLPDGKIKILFEGHIFHKYTNGKFVNSNPDICYPQWTTKFYTRGANAQIRGDGELERLKRAKRLDKTAAYMSISTGRFQVMGFNSALCGYKDAETFFFVMCEDETNHLKAFCDYVKETGLTEYLRNRDWARFARRYNGPGYQKNEYDTKLAVAYDKYKRNETLYAATGKSA